MTFSETTHLITEIHDLRARVSAQRDHWQAALSPYFEGESTDWGRLQSALEWLRQLRELTGPVVPPALKAMLIAETRRWPDFRGLAESRGAYVASRDQLIRPIRSRRGQKS